LHDTRGQLLTQSDLDKIDQLQMTGQYPAALAIVDLVLSMNPVDLDALLARINILRNAKLLDAAKSAIEATAPVIADAGNAIAEADFAYERGCFILQQAGRLAEALECFRDAVRAGSDNVDHCSAMCSTLCWLDRYDEAIEWRQKILHMRAAEVDCAPEDVITAGRPKEFDPARPERNIVSYCLFGNDPYFHQCAITNARVTPVMFPEFTARFYCAPDLPGNVLEALAAAGAQVMISQNHGGEGMSPMAGTFWRFLTFDDPDVDVVLCRDVDSPILPRERAAIDMWLAGSAPFYGLRDHPIHAELLLAGLWGGFTGVLPPLGPLASKIIQIDHTKFADQTFLRTVIWPRVRDHAILSIDSFPSLAGAVDFPEGYPKHGRQHVGVAWTRAQILGKG
jgi:hypothetical protein